MNKKFLGIRIGTIFTAVGCVIAALALWILAKYLSDARAVFTVLPLLRG